MEFVKEFSSFLHENGVIKFGDFTLSSGKKSPYYIDLRIVPSYPHQFRKMIKHLQNEISENIGLDNFDYLVSVPTSGLVIASALAIETVKPLIYVRDRPKDYGTSKLVEGHFESGKKALMIDDVATTGDSVINALKSLKNEGVVITDTFVIIDRMEGAEKAMKSEGVKMHNLVNILEITNSLHEQNLISDSVLNSVKKQIN